jgi:hypothetical protein
MPSSGSVAGCANRNQLVICRAAAYVRRSATSSVGTTSNTPSDADGTDADRGCRCCQREGEYAVTDALGFFSLRPLWVCPCSGEPRVDAGATSLWVGKDGYQDPAGQPSGRFLYYVGPGYRDVMIDGDTRVDIHLVRR